MTETKRISKAEQDRLEAIAHLRTIIKPGDTVYTVLRHVSRSGMKRGIDCYLLQPEGPEWITAYVGKAIGSPQSMEYWRKSLGLKIGGCGMDMGFHVVDSLSYARYGPSAGGYACLGNGKCPSNYHSNHHDTVRCEGTRVYNPDGPDTGSPCFWCSDLSMHVVEDEDGNLRKCPTCKGKGRLPNPDGPERFDLVHTDGYAIRHRWL